MSRTCGLSTARSPHILGDLCQQRQGTILRPEPAARRSCGGRRPRGASRLSTSAACGWDAQFDIVLRHTYHALRIGGACWRRAVAAVSLRRLDRRGRVRKTGGPVQRRPRCHLVRAPRMSWARTTRVNAVFARLRTHPATGRRAAGRTLKQFSGDSAHRIATPEDVATSIAFLLADASSVISGQSLPLDGSSASSWRFRSSA